MSAPKTSLFPVQAAGALWRDCQAALDRFCLRSHQNHITKTLCAHQDFPSRVRRENSLARDEASAHIPQEMVCCLLAEQPAYHLLWDVCGSLVTSKRVFTAVAGRGKPRRAWRVVGRVVWAVQ